MTQLSFTTAHKGFTVLVYAGWDSPCQRYYMVVEADENDPAGDEAGNLYSNLDDDQVPKHYSNQLMYFKAKLVALGITPEPNFFERVEAAND
jgi:hypothetical protein